MGKRLIKSITFSERVMAKLEERRKQKQDAIQDIENMEDEAWNDGEIFEA